VSAPLALPSQRLVVVTGKGGVGKSMVAAALARAAANAGRRVLAVDVASSGLARRLGVSGASLDPTASAVGPYVAAVEPADALGDWVRGFMPVPLLSRRLLESTTFQIVAAAAPGLPEYLVLQRLNTWLDERRLGRVRWQLVVVDAPASGHSLPLLAAPATLTALARVGPIATTLGRIDRRLHDSARTAVWIVTRPEDLPVAETIELHRELDGRLGLPVARPIANGVPDRRFSAHDAALLEATGAPASDPLMFAAALTIARRREATAQLRVLRRALPHPPVRLRLLHEEVEGCPRARQPRVMARVRGLVGFASEG
jgi:anion-transporting  ArsA/GET3 family ATPase